MRRSNMWHRMIISAAILLIAVSAASADTILSVQPFGQSVMLGSQALVDLNIAGLGDPPSLGTFDININFDPTILSFNNFLFGDLALGDQLDPTGGANTINFINPGFGTVEMFEISLDSATTLNSLQASSFTLGVLTFDTIGGGTSSLDVTINALGDADGNALSESVQNGGVSVSAVPEPSTIYLSCAALFAMVILRHLRRFSGR